MRSKAGAVNKAQSIAPPIRSNRPLPLCGCVPMRPSGSRKSTTLPPFSGKIMMVAETTFRRLNATELLKEVYNGITFTDGLRTNKQHPRPAYRGWHQSSKPDAARTRGSTAFDTKLPATGVSKVVDTLRIDRVDSVLLIAPTVWLILPLAK
jgi:hypothetical protein